MAAPSLRSVGVLLSLALLAPSGALAQAAEPAGGELAWQRTDELPGPETALVDRIAVSPDGTIAVLGQTAFDQGPALGWVSSDGLAWEPAKLKDADFSAPMDLLALPEGGFIAWPYLGAQLWRSPDGRTRKRDTREGSVFFGDGIASEDGLRFVGQSPEGKPAALRSSDGKKWSATELPAADSGDQTTPNLVTRLADGTFLAAATAIRDGATLWRSDDGSDWQIFDGPYSVFGGVVTPDGELVTIGRVEFIKGSATWLGSPVAE